MGGVLPLRTLRMRRQFFPINLRLAHTFGNQHLRSVDADGLTLRHGRKVPWQSIGKICVSCDYLDGHVARVEIHHRDGISKIPVRARELADEFRLWAS